MTTASRVSAVFNSPIESATRIGFLLAEAFPLSLDMQQLVHFDFLVVHTSDAGGPKSLHPALPHRSGEWVVRRTFVQDGLHALARKGLAAVDLGRGDGVRFIATDGLSPFLRLLRSAYALELGIRARWVTDTFGGWTEERLRALIEENIAKWGGEFELEASAWDEAP